MKVERIGAIISITIIDLSQDSWCRTS